MTVDAINMAVKILNMFLGNYNKGIVHVASPHLDLITKSADGLLFNMFHN